MKPAVTTTDTIDVNKTLYLKKSLKGFLIKPLVAAIFMISALTTSTAALASDCSCSSNSLPTMTIEDSNDTHPNQLALKANKAYYQLTNQNGQVLQDRLYDVTPYEDGRIIAKRDGRFGLIGADGQLIFDFAYDAIEILPADLYRLSKYQGAISMDALVKGGKDWLYPASGKFENKVAIEQLYHDETNDISYFKVTEKGKVGLINDKKQTLVPSIYDELNLLDTCPNERLFMMVKSGDKTGLMDQYQKFVVPLATNQSIDNFNRDEQVFKVSKNHYSSYNSDDRDEGFISDTLIKGNGKTLVESDSPITNASNNLYQFSQAGKYGIINSDGKIILPANFEYISTGSDAPIIVTQKGKQGILRQDQTTKQFIVANYYDQLQSIDIADRSLAELQTPPEEEQSEYAVSDDAAEAVEVVEAAEAVEETTADYDQTEVDSAEEAEVDYTDNDYGFDNTLYVAKLNNKFGLIDAEDNVRIPFFYDEISESMNALLVKKNQEYGLLTTQNETVAGIVFDSIAVIENAESEPLYILTQGDKQSIIDSVGRPILPLSPYRLAAGEEESQFESRIIVDKNGKYGLLNDRYDAVLVPTSYEKFDYELSNKSILAQKDGRKVLLDSSGQIMPIDLSAYTEVTEMYASENLKVVAQNGKQGVLTPNGKVLIAPLYDSVDNIMLAYYSDNRTDYYMVELDERYGLLDDKGKTIIKPKYTGLNPLQYLPFLVASDYDSGADYSKVGLINAQGKVVKAFNYDAIYESYYDDDQQIVLIMLTNNKVQIYNQDLKLIETMSAEEYEQSH